jgi:hypothetical protein
VTDVVAWRRCSACKKPIPYEATWWACNVSTCNRPRTGLAFCSVTCWEVHLPGANHRESWAVERRAPRRGEQDRTASAQRSGGSERTGQRRLVRPQERSGNPSRTPREILVVASRLKDYVRAKSGYNTSDGVLEPLSDLVRRIADEAIQNAERAGRRTVLDRDVPKG